MIKMRGSEKLIVIASVVLILLISGCVSVSKPVSINEKKKVDIADIVQITGARMVPSPPLMPGMRARLVINVKNVHSSATAKCIHARLYSYQPFEIVGNNNMAGASSCYVKGYSESNPKEVVNRGDLFPGAETTISYDVKAPTADEIGNVTTDIDLAYRMTYNFEGSTLFQFVVVNQSQMNSLESAGRSISLETFNQVGPGPIKVEMELQNNDNMVLAGTSGIIEFKIVNEGSGKLSNYANTLSKGKLIIGLPSDLNVKFSGIKMAKTSCPDGFIKDLTCYKNDETITLYQTSSVPYKITFTKSSLDQLQKTYTAEAQINYQYMLYGDYKVEVNPHETN